MRNLLGCICQANRIMLMVGLLAQLATPCWGQTGGDRILPREGRPIAGTITRTTPTHLIVDVRGQERQIPIEDIELIAFGGEPSGLRRAREALKDGQYEVALQETTNLDAGDLQGDLLRAEAAYMRAFARAKLGEDVEAAAREMAGFLQANSQSHHYFEGMEVLGDLLMQMGRYQHAAESYSRMGRAPWPETKIRAAVREARALLAQGPAQADTALARFEQVLAANVTGVEVAREKQLARVGKAASLVAKGQAAEAVDILNELIADANPEDVELFAQLYNALGAAHRALNQPKPAIHAYLHTHLLYHRAPEAHAEALYHLSELWREVGKADRGLEAQQILRTRYASSPWAQK